jgi:serine/threonine-protein kinase
VLAENTIISHYRILSRIGVGGMGEVYLAEDARLGRRVALKLLSQQSREDEDRLRRFEQEARAASALNHPNIITIHEIGSARGSRFIAMEFVEGETVRQRLRRDNMSVREAVDVAMQVAGALAAAHRIGILHRDIKPENIMLRPDGIVKVLDFGVAKLTEKFAQFVSGAQPASGEDGGGTTLDLVTTEANIVMGSPNYMSPEQARALPVDARSDIFSLGSLTYEMLTGTMPFKGATVSDVVVSILEREPTPLAECLPEAPVKLQTIVARALAKDLAQRYQRIEDFFEDLKRIHRRLDLQTGLDESARLPDSGVAVPTGPQAQKTVAELIVRSDQVPTVRATSSAEYIVGEIKQHKRGFIFSIIGLALTVVLAYLAFSTRAHPIDSIAVLPFVNGSSDPNAEYLSEGLTDSLINNLSQSRNLKVMSRNAVFKYKAGEADQKTAARELKVHGVVTGKIVQLGDSISINVGLIDSRDDTQVWGEQYNRRMGDLFTLQEQIAKDVAEKLQLKLSGEDQKRVTKRYTDDSDAYQLYLRGRFYWNKRTEDGMKKGAEYFNQAIAKDPNYALAYAGLADCYALLYEYSAAPSSDLYPKANAAAMRALELDDSLAEAHTSLAAAYEYEWNWNEAEKQYAKAIELNPNYETAHHWYSAYLIARKRFDEAIAESRRALELNPLSLIINTALGRALHSARRYDEAIEQLRKTLDMDSNFAEAHFHLAFAYEGKKSYDDAIREYERYIELSGDKSMKAWVGRVYAEYGRKQQALKVLAEVLELSRREQPPLFAVATLYAALGDKDRAFEWLERVHAERNYYVVFLNSDPALDGLREDPRFSDLLRRIGLN